MSAQITESSALLSLQVKDTSVTVTTDENPVANYAFFCRQYNLSKNIVDNTAYEVPNVQTRGYRMYRYVYEWFSAPCGGDVHCDSMFCSRLSCDSYCGPCDYFGRILVTFAPAIALITGILSILLFFLDQASSYSQTNFALVPLIITVSCLMIPLGLISYMVCYLKLFFRLVSKNFAQIPRNRVLSNMVWVPGYNIVNKHLEISGHIAAALKRGQLSYDQINDQAALSSLTV